MRVNILGVTVDTYSMSETAEKIKLAVSAQRPIRVVTANPEIIYASQYNWALKNVINSADIITADGIGVVWAARQLGTQIEERVTGIDLVQSLFPIANAEKWRMYFLGGRPGIAEQAVKQVAEDYPGIVFHTSHGYFQPHEESGILKEICEFRPDVLLVGLGAPRQEFWLAEHPGLTFVGIGVGGSFDALAGTVRRAPKQFQDLHIEWLYRLLKEPWRWKRQTVLPRFLFKVLWQRLKS
ncbi:teichoic acid biosynthesis protein [Desulfosporosinus acidiphilus SJ4]|uniref:N-acetylglucosaminyldiphosphoundecaprenol N-acetyl-beta-D-mannosaminyltransferase n=1 Tax=Desulfosporosinus acidiphilus (strain DSM 22704 / JCM 16185 / SJ4) TaxID=646529 RepID=I4DCC8_DESAJ|nr:WecB/TagA/CpsF family glycosyltransferase [Desulfosporosinus acidiphilus]AFM43452.1 teichoic acid biosynthesis protein [Desulfosporosinus acidiphilus SJ4]